MNRPEYNDNPLPIDEGIYDRLRAHGKFKHARLTTWYADVVQDSTISYPSILHTFSFGTPWSYSQKP